jgi:hypothetical protein
MNALDNLILIHRYITAMNSVDGEMYLNANENGTVIPWVLINDVFYFASADAEDVTLDNIHVLEQACKDVEAACPRSSYAADPNGYNVNKDSAASVLFACRVRKMRPFKEKGSYGVHKSVEPLIDAVEVSEEFKKWNAEHCGG